MGRILGALDRKVIKRTIVIDVVAGLFLAVIGPFNTNLGPILPRIVYWEAVLLLGSGLGVAITVILDELMDPDGGRPFLMAGVASLLMTPLTTLMVYGATALAFGQGATGTLLSLAPPVFIICLGMSLVNALAHKEPLVTHAAEGPAPAAPRFLERVPQRLQGAELLAIKAEDHYLRVYTARGSDLILMRLSDAIAELDGLEGAQTHRSWWVARAAVRSVSKSDGRAVLRLSGDLEAPVSRNFARALRSEGWLD